MSAADVRARLAALREAGRDLRERSGAAVVDVLAAVLERWRDPDGPERRALERELPGVAGFSAANVREGLARALAPWTGDALRDLARRALAHGADYARGHDVTSVLLAGSIPMPTLLAVIEPLALRSPLLAKTASRDPLTAQLVARSIAAVDAELGRCVAVVGFPGGDEESMAAFLEADCIVATGADATVDAVAERVRPPRRVLRHGHRLSVALLGPEAIRGEALAEAARGIALDTALWDQLGCLSPVAVYAVGDTGRCREVGAALADALAALETTIPRGAVEPRAAALAAHERAGAELRAAAGSAVVVHAGAKDAWTVVCEGDATPRPMPLHRFLRVHPVATGDALSAALTPLAPHLAGAALAGFADAEPGLRARLAGLGATRLCRPGALQCPPLDWPRDGLPPLRALAQGRLDSMFHQ